MYLNNGHPIFDSAKMGSKNKMTIFIWVHRLMDFQAINAWPRNQRL